MKQYNYKCIVNKNGNKMYYKRVSNKWKRVSNATGMKAEKGKRKYRIDDATLREISSKHNISPEEYKTQLDLWEGRDPAYITSQLKLMHNKYANEDCDPCIQDIRNVDLLNDPFFRNQSQRNKKCKDCLEGVALLEPTRGKHLFPIMFGSMKTARIVKERSKRKKDSKDREEYARKKIRRRQLIPRIETLLRQGKKDEAKVLIEEAEVLDLDMMFLQAGV